MFFLKVQAAEQNESAALNFEPTSRNVQAATPPDLTSQSLAGLTTNSEPNTLTTANLSTVPQASVSSMSSSAMAMDDSGGLNLPGEPAQCNSADSGNLPGEPAHCNSVDSSGKLPGEPAQCNSASTVTAAAAPSLNPKKRGPAHVRIKGCHTPR